MRLSIRFTYHKHLALPYGTRLFEEESFISFQMTAETAAKRPSYAHHLHLAVCRIIITAARAGHARRLVLSEDTDAPLRHPSLMPHWIELDVASAGRLYRNNAPWLRAAASLRYLLARVSLWLGTSSTSSRREERQLEGQEIQSLPAYFRTARMPSVWEVLCHGPQPFALFLPHIRDEALARRIAAAWNEVVRR